MALSLNNFSSYYELMVGFSVAYTAIESVSNFFNEVTYKKYEEDRKHVNQQSDLAKKLLVVYQDSQSLNDLRLRDEFAGFEKQVDEVRLLFDYIEKIGSGQMFRSFFKLTGAFFLYMTLLTCFAGIIHDEVIILMGFNLATIYILFFIVKFSLLKISCLRIPNMTYSELTIQNTKEQETRPEKSKLFSFIKGTLAKISIISMSSLIFFIVCQCLKSSIDCLVHNIILCIVLFIKLYVWDYFHDNNSETIIGKPIRHEYLRTFVAMSIIVTIFTAIEYYSFGMKSYFSSYGEVCQFIDIPKVELMKAVAMFFTINFATVPFFVYFLRNYFYIEGIQKNMNAIKIDTDEKFKLYSEYFKRNPVVKV